jgi:hypothetical protein
MMKREFKITQDFAMLGRGERCVEKEAFQAYLDVAELHCEVYYEKGQWFILHVSGTNGTFLNGKELFHKEPRTLRDGDHLRISSLPFIISIKHEQAPTEEPAAEPQEKDRREIIGWIIHCTVSGRPTEFNQEVPKAPPVYCECRECKLGDPVDLASQDERTPKYKE